MTFLAPPKCRRRSKTGGPDIAASSQKTHQRPSYGLASFALSGFCRTPSETRPHRPQAARSLQRYLRARSLAACCAYGSFQGLTAPQSDATNYPPARHRTPGDIISEPRATSSRNARATSSESATKSPHVRNWPQTNGVVMAKKGREWTKRDVRELTTLARQKAPAAKIAKSLKRTLGATRKKASELGVSLDSRG